jgi:hypothetical protein
MQQSTNAIQMLPDDVRKLWIRLAAGLRKATNVRGIYDLTKWIGDRYLHLQVPVRFFSLRVSGVWMMFVLGVGQCL